MVSTINIHLSSNRITSNSQKALTLSNQKKIGEIKDKLVFYSPYEAQYLIDINQAKLIKNKKQLNKEESRKILLKNKDTYNRYLVYKHLRKKGFIPKAALKFGADFRVYKKSEKHAKWLCMILPENTKLSIKDFALANRTSHQTAKKLLLAIIDTEEKISFYETDWLKL